METTHGKKLATVSTRKREKRWVKRPCIGFVRVEDGVKFVTSTYRAWRVQTSKCGESGQSNTWIGRENLRHDNLRDDWKKIAWIDIDEKWFYMRTRKKKKLHSEQKETKTAIKSKRFIEKVMGLCAVGRPQGDFDGIIGIYRCSEKRRAKRNSKFHARGEWYEVDCEVNGEMFRRMVETRLIPDIQCKLLGYDCVYVQLDGARAHVKVLKDLNKFGARRRQIDGQKTPVIRFVRQPANSPDTNVLNLCFFRSLVKLVSFFEERKEVQTRLWRQGSIFEACHADFPRLSRQRDDGQLLKDEEHRRPTDHWRTKDERLRASARLHRVETNSSRTQRRFERRRRALGTNTVLRRRPRSASLCTQSRPLMMALMRRQDDRTIRYVNLQGPELISKSWEARALQTPPESRTSDRSLRSNSFHDNQMFKWHL